MQALAIGGAGLNILGGIVEGQASENAGAYNQSVANRNALDSERDAATKEADIREQVRQRIGQQLVAQGGSGFEVGQGSALDAIKESQINGMLDALRVRRQGSVEAANYRQQGVIAKMTGDNQAKRSYFGAASALVGGIRDYAKAGGG